MPTQVDPAILEALGLDASSASIASHSGGSGFASTFKVSSTQDDGSARDYFVKTAAGQGAEVMFRGMLNPKGSRADPSLIVMAAGKVDRHG